MKHTSPIKLTSGRAWRTYTGGSQIDKIHGIENSPDTQFPEEWIMSTVVARNAGREDIVEGMCYLEENKEISLKDYIENYSLQALGPEHCKTTGKTTGVLVKVIDAAERLTVQVHPNKEKALSLFNSKFGKTECWYILGGRTIDGEEPSIYFGFKEGITREEWKRCFDQQDIPSLLNHMHHIYVKPGDTFLIKGGVPHAIGQGCLLVEIQEPTDYTIRVERTTPKGLKVADMGCHQGLGFEKMFDCFDYDGASQSEIESKYKIPAKIIEDNDDFKHIKIIGHDSTECFEMERYEISGKCTLKTGKSFYGIYILTGEGTLTAKDYSAKIKAGDQFFIPYDCKPYLIEAEKDNPVTVFCCYGPEAK